MVKVADREVSAKGVMDRFRGWWVGGGGAVVLVWLGLGC